MLHLADDVIGELVEPPAAKRAVWAAFEAWGRGSASTTQRVRAISADGMASAMAAVVPPYCGGKLYATAHGRFTFVNVLFHTDGRVLATLDGDALICAVGATKYDRAEIGADVIERCATVVCDDVAGSRVECGDLIQAAAAGRFDWDRTVELHAVAAGTVTVARAGPAPVLFETQGVAIQDVAVAALAYERYTNTAGRQPATSYVRERSTA